MFAAFLRVDPAGWYRPGAAVCCRAALRRQRSSTSWMTSATRSSVVGIAVSRSLRGRSVPNRFGRTGSDSHRTAKPPEGGSRAMNERTRRRRVLPECARRGGGCAYLPSARPLPPEPRPAICRRETLLRHRAPVRRGQTCQPVVTRTITARARLAGDVEEGRPPASGLAAITIRSALRASSCDSAFVARLEHAKAPFWQAVREALVALRASSG